jgi:hypothetical protein|tara:strand:+ start:3825 stop:4004 length:180 start_codon:yes stop_codon:yes gene_type:complete
MALGDQVDMLAWQRSLTIVSAGLRSPAHILGGGDILKRRVSELKKAAHFFWKRSKAGND